MNQVCPLIFYINPMKINTENTIDPFINLLQVSFPICFVTFQSINEFEPNQIFVNENSSGITDFGFNIYYE